MGTLTRMDLSKVSLNNQYQVHIAGISFELKRYLQQYYDLPNDYANGNKVGIMCAEDLHYLPVHLLHQKLKIIIKELINSLHIQEYMLIVISHFVDQDYNVLKFFEGWMDYVAGDDNFRGITRTDDNNYYRRLNYPMNRDTKIGYKSAALTITKFEKNLDPKKSITYEYVNAFPKSMTSIPVQYGGADLVKVNVQFAYDRYIMK